MAGGYPRSPGRDETTGRVQQPGTPPAEREKFSTVFQTVLDYLGIPATADGRHATLENYQFYLAKGLGRDGGVLFDVQIRMSDTYESYPPTIHGHSGEEALRTIRRAQVADAFDTLFARWASKQYVTSKQEPSRAERLEALIREIVQPADDDL